MPLPKTKPGPRIPELCRVLMVTRESPSDRRYGLGKSLAPVMESLGGMGIEVAYLTAGELGLAGVARLRAWHPRINRTLGWLLPGTDFWSLSWGLLERFNMGRLAAHVARQHGFTHVHCHDPFIALAYRAFSVFGASRKRPWGVTQHGFGSFTQAFHEDGAVLGPRVMRALRRWEQRVLSQADWVVLPAHADAEQLARDLGHYPLPAHWRVIPHPRPSRLRVLPRAQARQALGWGSQGCYLIAVGRFAPLKRLPALLEACARLENAEWRLVLVGDGDREPLQALAASLGIGERLAFAATDDIGLYYSAADIYVSTSTTESFGLANLEAVSLGLPALCTTAGATPEVLGSGAWLVPPENPAALTSALQALVGDPELRAFWSARARAWAAVWPEVDAVTQAYLAMYRGQPHDRTALRPGIPAPESPFALWRARAESWSVCPLPSRLDLPSGGTALVLAPHSDDETLGCGGTLARLRQAGWRVRVLVITDGSQGDPCGYLGHESVVAHRQRETRIALDCLGVEEVNFLAMPEGESFAWEAVGANLEEQIEALVPNWLLVPPVLDFHRDHVHTSLLALDLWQERGYRERLFFYELWQPLPINRVVDVTPVLARKRQAIAAYRLPLRYLDYAAAFEGLMRYRGIYLTPGPGTHAEGLLELEAGSWRAVVAELMYQRGRQETTVLALAEA